MTFGTAIYTIFLKPLQLIFEVIYSIAYQNIKNPGLAIIALSLAINFLVLPLYKRADAMQEEERDIEAKLSKWVTHIKKTFRGDERTMMLQMYYKQNNYSPAYVLRSAVSLFLEIPFFIAAYNFLSELELLKGTSFGPISDLSQPDALLKIGGLAINVLPVLMTVINIISSAIFSKDYPLKTKIQLYAMAAFFLVFLYDSPSGLVFYWTLNNAFSLVKTIFYKIKNPKFILSVLSALAGLGLIIGAVYTFAPGTRRTSFLIAAFGLILFVPIIVYLLKQKGKLNFKFSSREPSTKNFILASLFLAVLTGLVIPSAVLKASPQEFIDVNYFVHPLWYLAHSFLLSLGMFVFWFGVFYWLASPKAKPIFECVMWAFCGIAVIDYLFFGTNLGTMSSDLAFDKAMLYTFLEILINFVVVVAVFGLFAFIFIKCKKIVPKFLAVILVAFVGMSAINCVQIKKSIASVDMESFAADNTPHFTLSKTGKNVVVIMLDRAMGEYVPYIFNEKPELKEKFSGFTYYSNTVSFGGHTNFATPALYGGYEYTPVELNKRDNELLKDKHNEALKVMPVLFNSKGYNVTVFDPPYAGYQEIPDLSIYKDYPEIGKYITMGYFTSKEEKQNQVACRNRNFFCYGLTKTMPLFAQRLLYENGHYNQVGISDGQTIESPSKAQGTVAGFMKSYNVWQNISNITNLTDDKNGSFLMMANDITHTCAILSEPDYSPKTIVDNTEYDLSHKDRFSVNGNSIPLETAYHYSVYHTNMAAFIQLGNWFDYLKSNNVYDNTRIILVSDHGFGVAPTDNFILDNEETYNNQNHSNAEYFYPLLMVKDFNSKEFSISDEFMTNADVPTLATSNLIENPVNPLTGKEISNSEKNAHDQYVIASNEFSVSTNNGTTYKPSKWYSVHDSIWDKNNWTKAADNAVIPEKAK